MDWHDYNSEQSSTCLLKAHDSNPVLAGAIGRNA